MRSYGKQHRTNMLQQPLMHAVHMMPQACTPWIMSPRGSYPRPKIPNGPRGFFLASSRAFLSSSDSIFSSIASLAELAAD